MSDSFYVEAESLKEFGEKLVIAADLVQAEMTRTVVKSAEIVAAEARSTASQYSRSIPGTIHAGPAGEGMAFIRAGGEDVPIASLYELGNKGARRKATFRHPVFGNWNVSDPAALEQDRHPFLAPARLKTRRVTNKMFEHAWNEALKVTGLKTTWHEG